MLENQLSRYGAIAKDIPFTTGKVFFAVSSNDTHYGDFQHQFPADKNGVNRVHSTIQGAIDAAAVEPDPSAGHIVLIKPQEMAAGATDPTNWAETLIIAAAQANLQLIGMTDSRAQGGIAQIKKGSGSTALLTVRAPGCLIKNLGFNGGDSTGGGILLDDDGSTKTAFGTTIENCHFKNCVGSTATNAATGGAIQWTSSGNAWQVLVKGCRFYKNVGDIVMKGTGGSIPQDVVIEDCVFSGPAASTDCNIYTAADGINGLIIRNCVFTAKPAIGSGTNARYVSLTGSVGIMANCYFASIVSPTGSEGTFAADGTLAIVPATVFIVGCYGETTTTAQTGEIFRT